MPNINIRLKQEKNRADKLKIRISLEIQPDDITNSDLMGTVLLFQPKSKP